jgi:glucose-1-phosphate adenylyltransferase
VFTARFLTDELRQNAQEVDPGRDFGHHTLPGIIARERVHAFTYTGEGTGGGVYWRDVGTVDAYFRANMDLLTDAPELDLYDKTWPIYSFQPSFPPPKVAVAHPLVGGSSGGPRRNIFANGTVAEGWLAGTVVGFDCRIDREAVVEDSILFDGVCLGRGARVRRAVVDKAVQVRPGARVGFDPDEDRGRGFLVSEDGVTCVPRGAIIAGPS